MHKTDEVSGNRIKYPDRAGAAHDLIINFGRGLKETEIVLAIPRGGVVIGKVIAQEIGASLDLLLCKKVGHPENSEYAIGSVCADGTRILTDSTSDYFKDHFERQCRQMEAWLKARYQVLSGRERPMDISGKKVLIVDDGLATGSTMLSAIRSVRTGGAVKVMVTTPVASTEAAASVSKSADVFFCPLVSDQFHAVGQFYERFETVTDEQVMDLMSLQYASGHK